MGDQREQLPIMEATRDNVPAMARTLALAFADEPALTWIIPDRAERLRRLERFFPLVARRDVDKGLALHSPGSEVTTLWRVPGATNDGPIATLAALPGYLRAFGGKLGRAMKVGGTIEAHQPKEPFLHLHYAAVRPDRQGQGLAGKAIRSGLERARAMGVQAFLETADPKNVGIYSRLGFVIVEEYDVAGGGPHFWAMRWQAD